MNDTPATSDFDVVVVGGGTAGVVAAIAAGRSGARTLLVEASGNLGGNAAVGMTFGGFHDIDRRQVIQGIPEEIVQRCMALGGRGHVTIDSDDIWISTKASADSETVKFVCAEMVTEAGVTVWLRSSLLEVETDDAGRVTAIDVVCKSGRIRITARMFVDTSGDGDLAAGAGAQFERGGGDRQQLISTMFRVGNVDVEALENYMNTVINVDGKDPWRAESAFLRGSHEYWLPWKFDPAADHFPRTFGVYHHGTEGDLVINAVGVPGNGLDVTSLSAAEIELRKQSTELFWWLRDNAPGFEKSYLSQVYPVGVRESRRIIGEHQVTLEDMMAGVVYPDTVAMGAYPPDLHDAKSGSVHISKDDNRAYALPLGAMIPTGLANVIVAGRCISATFDAESGLRGIGPSMALGQAAGTAAALAALDNGSVTALDVVRLQDRLRQDGAFLPDALVT
ncbi:FAD-dependent oxidoreductase [Microbacterium aurantiacum]|uniref:FAD-dependent oxidoreductase n=1 Tax=Microbacterium aurantiacum TaxID=162393 RepID=A0AAJ2M015_9MICO|nr:FAD-dependent oxidoreductase [Microbacterium aurantiacum]MDS0246973.1 FAD-dependent oxidoreductase [Microbacterium aurantiacum]